MQTSKICIAVLLSFVSLTVGSNVPSPAMYQQSPSYEDLSSREKKEVECLAQNIYFEARDQSYVGQKAVALVTMNRVSKGTFADTVCGVVRQRVNSVCQFSWWCDAKLKAKAIHRKFDDFDTYQRAHQIALFVFLNYESVHDVTRGALFYHATYVPKQSLGVKNLRRTVQIGQHIFYRI